MAVSNPPSAATPNPPPEHLQQTLGPVTLWRLGVGYVISGEYFGWNLGLPVGGTLGMLMAFLLATVMYVTFVYSYAEMACAIPRAGGIFVYAGRALGPDAAYLGGVAQAVEFVFAPPAIAAGIGGYCQAWLSDGTIAYWNQWVPISLSVAIALAAMLIFTALNIWGIRQAALFELVVTALAVWGLLAFALAAGPHVRWMHLSRDAWPHGWSGAVGAIPFAICRVPIERPSIRGSPGLP